MNSFLTFLVGFLVSFLSTPLFIKLAHRLSILDHPEERKMHQSPIPLFGGMAVYCGFMAGLLLNYRYFEKNLMILLPATIILIVGLVDDVYKLSPRLRLFFQLVASFIITFGVERINILPPSTINDFFEVMLTLLWLVGIINAYNYLDGLDGLAGSSLVIHAFFLILILYKTNQYFLMACLLSLAAAVVGFLPFNLYKAKIFLGDAGSTLLGFTLASIAVIGNWAHDSWVKLSIPILILGVPIYDMCFTTVIRIKEGKVKSFPQWLKYAGKDHFHHYLVALGLPPLGTVAFISAVNLLLGMGALLIENGRMKNAFLALFQSFIVFLLISILIISSKRKSRS